MGTGRRDATAQEGGHMRGLRICISSQLPGAASAAGIQTRPGVRRDQSREIL